MDEHDGPRGARVRIAGAALAALLIAIVVGIAVWRHESDADKRAGAQAAKRLDGAVKQGRPIALSSLAAESFDRLVVVPGTADRHEIDRSLGFSWRRAEEEEYKCCDPYPLWLFVDDAEVIAWFRSGEQISSGAPSTEFGSYDAKSVATIDGHGDDLRLIVRTSAR